MCLKETSFNISCDFLIDPFSSTLSVGKRSFSFFNYLKVESAREPSNSVTQIDSSCMKNDGIATDATTSNKKTGTLSKDA